MARILSVNEQQRVVTLNNEGIRLLAACEDEKALLRLRDSLFTLKSLVNSSTEYNAFPHENQKADPSNSMSAESSLQLDFAPHEVSPSFEQPQICGNSDIQSEGSPSLHFLPSISLPGLQHDSQGFIFSKPFIFRGTQTSRDFHASLHLYGAVVIFNIALAHHRIGTLTGWQSYLEKAVVFYISCLQLLEKGDRRLGNIMIVKLAALNNASQLQFELGDHLVARRGFDMLSDLIAGVGADTVAKLNQDDSDGLILNVVLLRNGKAAAAA